MSTIQEFPMVRLTGLALAALVLAASAGNLAAQQPAAPAPAQANPLRFAYINSQVILANTPGRAEAESLFAREMVGFRAEAQRLQQQLDSTIAEYNRTGLVLSPTARQARSGSCGPGHARGFSPCRYRRRRSRSARRYPTGRGAACATAPAPSCS